MSEHKHLTGDESIRRFYSADSETCGEFETTRLRMEARRIEAAAQGSVPEEFLAAQRRAVYARMGEKPRSFGAWVPALATAAALAVGLMVYHPGRPSVRPAQVAVQPDVADSQLFSELVSVEQSAEPRAALPIRALFEGTE
jgi:hypothetical protein